MIQVTVHITSTTTRTVQFDNTEAGQRAALRFVNKIVAADGYAETTVIR